MIGDVQEKKFDIILAKEHSRLARNGELSYKIKNLCENQGIHIITLGNAINTLTGNTNMFGLYAGCMNRSHKIQAVVSKRHYGLEPKKVFSRGLIPHMDMRLEREHCTTFLSPFNKRVGLFQSPNMFQIKALYLNYI
nr:recombinase family protein [Paraliobacillus zengyii]